MLLASTNCSDSGRLISSWRIFLQNIIYSVSVANYQRVNGHPIFIIILDYLLDYRQDCVIYSHHETSTEPGLSSYR